MSLANCVNVQRVLNTMLFQTRLEKLVSGVRIRATDQSLEAAGSFASVLSSVFLLLEDELG